MSWLQTLRQHRRPIVITLLVIIAIAAAGYGTHSLYQSVNTISVNVHPSDARTARIIKHDAAIQYEIINDDGSRSVMTPQQFADAVYQQYHSHSLANKLLIKLLNISSTANIAWVVLGLTGQILFAGRMLVQWLASEKKRESVIPESFWWLAIGGASMLIVYFIWRKDIVGILGQATGWLIYTRNLYFIYRRKWFAGKHDPSSETGE